MENANCSNNQGSYTCVCMSGYTGDGFSSCVSSEQYKKALITGLSVAIAGLVLIVTTLIIIIMLAYLRKRNKLIFTENVAYLSNTHSSSLKSHAAYAATSDQDPTIHTTTNEAYAFPVSVNEAYGIATATNEENNIMTTSNEAYVATDIPTSPNEAYHPLTYDYAYDYIPHTT